LKSSRRRSSNSALSLRPARSRDRRYCGGASSFRYFLIVGLDRPVSRATARMPRPSRKIQPRTFIAVSITNTCSSSVHDARMITWQVGHFWMIITQPGGSLSHADLHLSASIFESTSSGLIRPDASRKKRSISRLKLPPANYTSAGSGRESPLCRGLCNGFDREFPGSGSCQFGKTRMVCMSLGSRLIKLDPQPDRCQFDHRQEIA
jgi:hypothetical protein